MPATFGPFQVGAARVIDASPADLYRAWTDPAQLEGWFGARRILMDPVVDGLYFLDLVSEGRAWAHYGRFLRLEPPRRIEMTWMSEATRGRDTVVTILLVPRGPATEVRLSQTGLPDDALGRGHERSWEDMLERLEARMAKAATEKTVQ